MQTVCIGEHRKWNVFYFFSLVERDNLFKLKSCHLHQSFRILEHQCCAITPSRNPYSSTYLHAFLVSGIIRATARDMHVPSPENTLEQKNQKNTVHEHIARDSLVLRSSFHREF